MSEKTPSKVDHPKAPIKTTLTLIYEPYFTVIINMNTAFGQVEGFQLAGDIIRGAKPFMPRITYNKSVVCPNCHQESSLSMVDKIGVKCAFCNADLKGKMEI